MLVSRLCDRSSWVRASRPEKDSASRLQNGQIMIQHSELSKISKISFVLLVYVFK